MNMIEIGSLSYAYTKLGVLYTFSSSSSLIFLKLVLNVNW
jgi:hypothetical protein